MLRMCGEPDLCCLVAGKVVEDAAPGESGLEHVPVRQEGARCGGCYADELDRRVWPAQYLELGLEALVPDCEVLRAHFRGAVERPPAPGEGDRERRFVDPSESEAGRRCSRPGG